MLSILDIRTRYVAERGAIPFQPGPQFSGAGLMLGRGTILANNDPGSDSGETSKTERMAALLSASSSRRLSPDATRLVKRAVDRWRNGDKALAHIELAFARIPRLETEDDAFRRFVVETLLDEGVAASDVASAIDLEPGLCKYDPDQPRVPAGSGRASGRWGSRRSDTLMLDIRDITIKRRNPVKVQVASSEPLKPEGIEVVPSPDVDP